jgi:hypothetical protein
MTSLQHNGNQQVLQDNETYSLTTPSGQKRMERPQNRVLRLKAD